nr:DUF5958 family protein [Streptomyces sp. SAI-133]
MRDLAGFCIQARATSEDGPESIRRAGIRPTHTPAVLITRGHLTEQLAKIIKIPPDERVKAFRLLIALLGVADDRRRRFCADGCGHAWHHLWTGEGTETAATRSSGIVWPPEGRTWPLAHTPGAVLRGAPIGRAEERTAVLTTALKETARQRLDAHLRPYEAADVGDPPCQER